MLAGSWALPCEGPLLSVLHVGTSLFSVGLGSGQSSAECLFLSSSSSSLSTKGYAWAWVSGWWRWGAFTTARGLSHACRLSHAAQELWAVDRLQVQEFMLSFLRDPLREIEEPYFFLDEVSPT